MSFLRQNIKPQFRPLPEPTPTIVDQENIKPVKIKINKEKKEYEIGADKSEIIQNAISDKPSINDLRNALKRYAEISEEEYYEDQ